MKLSFALAAAALSLACAKDGAVSASPLQHSADAVQNHKSSQHFHNMNRNKPQFNNPFRRSSEITTGELIRSSQNSRKSSAPSTGVVQPGKRISKVERERRKTLRIDSIFDTMDGRVEEERLNKFQRLNRDLEQNFDPGRLATEVPLLRTKGRLYNTRSIVALTIALLIVFGSLYALVEYLLLAIRVSACSVSTVYIPVTYTMSELASAMGSPDYIGDSMHTVTSTSTSTHTLTSFVTVEPAVTSATGLISSGGPSYFYTVDSASSTDWVNGVSPTAGASLTTVTTTIVLDPSATGSSALGSSHVAIQSTFTELATVTPPSYTSTKYVYSEPDLTSTSTSTHYVTYTVSEASTPTGTSVRTSFPGIRSDGWNSSTSADRSSPVDPVATTLDPISTTITGIHYFGTGDRTTSTSTTFITTTIAVAYTTTLTPAFTTDGYVTTITALPLTITPGSGIPAFSTSINFDNTSSDVNSSPLSTASNSEDPDSTLSPFSVPTTTPGPSGVYSNISGFHGLTATQPDSVTKSISTTMSGMPSPVTSLTESSQSSGPTLPSNVNTTSSDGTRAKSTFSSPTTSKGPGITATKSNLGSARASPQITRTMSIGSSATSSVSAPSDTTLEHSIISTTLSGKPTGVSSITKTISNAGVSPVEINSTMSASHSNNDMTASTLTLSLSPANLTIDPATLTESVRGNTSLATSASNRPAGYSTNRPSKPTAAKSTSSSAVTSTSSQTSSNSSSSNFQSSTMTTSRRPKYSQSTVSPPGTSSTGNLNTSPAHNETSTSAVSTGSSPKPSTSGSAGSAGKSSTLGSLSGSSTATRSRPSATNPFPASSATVTPSNGCGEHGDFMVDFDDLPRFIPSNQNHTDISNAPPIENPYNHLTFSGGYVYAPPPDNQEPYTPVSEPHLAVFLAEGSGLKASSFGDVVKPGEIGDGPRDSMSAFWFDAYSAWVGCGGRAPDVCTFVLSAYTWDASSNDEVLLDKQNATVLACGESTKCSLHKLDFPTSFRSLTGLQIQAFVDDKEEMFFMDDLALHWSNNTCVAGLQRQQSL